MAGRSLERFQRRVEGGVPLLRQEIIDGGIHLLALDKVGVRKNAKMPRSRSKRKMYVLCDIADGSRSFGVEKLQYQKSAAISQRFEHPFRFDYPVALLVHHSHYLLIQLN